MHDITARVIKVIEALQLASIDLSQPSDPDLALLLSFEEACALHSDLMLSRTPELHYYVNVPGAGMELMLKTFRYAPLAGPPFPDGKRSVWCSFGSITLAIKGQEDA